jgi:Domain of unknown function (DUF5666)
MLTRLATLVQSKVALAVLGAALVAGGGTAAMVVAHSHSSAAGDHTAASTHTSSDAEGNHAHSVSIDGTLKGYDSGAGTISVLGQHDKTATTICVNGKTEVNGAHASKLSDLTAAVGHKVQVQATKQSSGSCSLLAWKVTVAGADGDQGNGDNGQNGQKTIDGAVTSVGSGSFAIKLSDGTTETVTVSTQTRFDGRVHNLAGLKTGDKVVVQGTDKGGGVFAATSVEVAGAD